MRRNLLSGAMILSGLLAAPSAALAQLERVGPISPVNGYPVWMQDKTGVAFEFCSPVNQAELDGGWCLLLPGDTTAPEVFPTSFFDEHFYWNAGSQIDAGNMRARLVLALEGAFANGAVVPGDQIVFGRLRLQITNLPVSGTYTIETPYGTFVFQNQVAGDRIFFTDDVGINCPGVFTCALNTRVAPFLLASTIAGGAELPPVSGPAGLYVADPARVGPVTGSPVGQNWFRVSANGVQLGYTDGFTLMGRLFQGSIPGRVTVNRASLTMNASVQKLDVFATAFPTLQSRMPGSTSSQTITPLLAAYTGACGRAADGSLIAPPAGTSSFQMIGEGARYWGQAPGSLAYTAVCVQDQNARDSTGASIPSFSEHTVTDDIAIASATWNNGQLSVAAASSVTGSALSLVGFGSVPGTFPAVVPPSEVTVQSMMSGSASLIVTTGVVSGGTGNTPFAANDAVSLPEDTSIDIDVLANDSWTGKPAGAVVHILTPPGLGTAGLNPDGTIHYQPNPNANGTDSISYTFTAGGLTSPMAFVAIAISQVNDPPSAVSDTTNGVVGVALAIPVLANDIDPDGAADLATAIIVTPPAGGATAVVSAGGVVTFTAPAAGTYSFTYRAVDQSNVQSGNTATVTVTVQANEVVAFVRADFVANKLRWRIDGTDTIHAGQTITVSYDNGTAKNGAPLAGTVIGTAVVDPTGVWAVDVTVATTDIRDVANGALFASRPTRVRATSSLSGAATATNPIALK
jgi:Bacterial Ig domain